MKILFINGSPRANGVTVKIMREIENNISQEHEVKWVNCYQIDIKPCVACLKCRPDNDCKMKKDDGHIVAEYIKNADCLVIGSPTYFGNVSGPLKTLIDRSLTAFESINANGLEKPIPVHKGKKASIITACNIPAPYSIEINHAGGVINALQIVLNAGGYNNIGSIIADSAVKLSELDDKIVKQAKIVAKKLTNL